jgi:hypothetical protein
MPAKTIMGDVQNVATAVGDNFEEISESARNVL